MNYSYARYKKVGLPKLNITIYGRFLYPFAGSIYFQSFSLILCNNNKNNFICFVAIENIVSSSILEFNLQISYQKSYCVK